MKYFLVHIIFLSPLSLFSQQPIDSSYRNPYYEQKLAYFKNVRHFKRDIVWLGDSITEQGPWAEILNSSSMVNRGIGGDNSFGILARLDEVLQSSPKKIFILAGINDIGRNLPIDIIEHNFQRMIDYIQKNSHRTKIFIQSVLPLCDSILKFNYLHGKEDEILALNKRLSILSAHKHIEFINIYDVFSKGSKQLDCSLTNDGLHLKSEAYLIWVHYLQANNYL